MWAEITLGKRLARKLMGDGFVYGGVRTRQLLSYIALSHLKRHDVTVIDPITSHQTICIDIRNIIVSQLNIIPT